MRNASFSHSLIYVLHDSIVDPKKEEEKKVNCCREVENEIINKKYVNKTNKDVTFKVVKQIIKA